MARIRAFKTRGGTHVKVSGRLTAADMGRFERACGSALTTRLPALEIDLTEVTDADRTAEALMQHLAERGAHIRHRLP